MIPTVSGTRRNRSPLCREQLLLLNYRLMSSIQHLLAIDRPAVPWKNGQGRTWQVAAHPEGADVADFDWRISIAEISQDGAFSAFPGVDRTIAVIDGAGVELLVDGVARELPPYQPFGFAGEAETSCRLLAGTTRDLNLLTSRGRANGSMKFLTVTGEDIIDVAGCLLVVAGSATVSTPDQQDHLERFDALLVRDTVTIRGDGAIVAIIQLRRDS
jgi:environmental stress-induced protein Ves